MWVILTNAGNDPIDQVWSRVWSLQTSVRNFNFWLWLWCKIVHTWTLWYILEWRNTLRHPDRVEMTNSFFQRYELYCEATWMFMTTILFWNARNIGTIILEQCPCSRMGGCRCTTQVLKSVWSHVPKICYDDCYKMHPKNCSNHDGSQNDVDYEPERSRCTLYRRRW